MLVADANSCTEGWTDVVSTQGLLFRTRCRTSKSYQKHICTWLEQCFIVSNCTLRGVKRFEVIYGLLLFPFATFRWPQSDCWSPRSEHEHSSVTVPLLHDISVQRYASPCKDILSSSQASTFKRSHHKINRYSSLFINCATYLL